MEPPCAGRLPAPHLVAGRPRAGGRPGLRGQPTSAEGSGPTGGEPLGPASRAPLPPTCTITAQWAGYTCRPQSASPPCPPCIRQGAGRPDWHVSPAWPAFRPGSAPAACRASTTIRPALSVAQRMTGAGHRQLPQRAASPRRAGGMKAFNPGPGTQTPPAA